MFARFITSINKWMAGISVFFTIVIMFSITADVALRFIAGTPITGVVELDRTLLVVIIFFTLGFTQVRKQHINVKIILDKLPARKRKLLMVFNTVLALVFTAMITYGSVISAYTSTIEGEVEVGILNYPIWPGRIAMAAGLFVLCCQYLVDIFRDLHSIFTEKEAE